MSNLFKCGPATQDNGDAPVKELTHTSILADAFPCRPGHVYLNKHAIEDVPCLVYTGFYEKDGVCFNGAILSRIHDANGNHVNTMLLHLEPDGREIRTYVNDLENTGCFVRIGSPSAGQILIVLDVASGCTLYLATGGGVVAACEVPNLSHVCQALAEAYPDHQRVLCLNAPPSANQGEGLIAVANNTGTQIAYLNNADQGPVYASFNDLHLQRGLDAVARRILKVVSRTGNVSELSNGVVEWPHPVDARYLLKKLIKKIMKHTVLSRQQAVAIALWIFFTYTIPFAQIAPILLISSPVKRCGKTTLGALLAFLVYQAIQSSSISAAALFREIEENSPTILIDEADTFLDISTELTGIINSGHTRAAAYAIRCVGGRSKRFRTFCAKVLMMIGLPSETILDRSIVISLMRKRMDQKVERLGNTETRELVILKAQISKWVNDNQERIAQATFEPPELGNDRAADNWGPLLAIAECIGDEWHEAALDAALELSKAPQDEKSLDELLLEDIQRTFADARQKKLRSADLIRALCADLEKPWGTVDRGRPLSQSDLAARLHKFGIHSKNIRHIQGIAKGYELEQFEDAFARYVIKHSD